MKYKTTYLLAVICAVLLCMFGAYELHAHHAPVAGSVDGDLDNGPEIPDATYTADVAQVTKSPKIKYAVSSSTPQFVVFSFDGSKSLEMLKETLDFEKDLRDGGTSFGFTYFINAVYFLTKDNATLYKPPRDSAGTSLIGYSDSTQDIADRVKAFNAAFASGNEIGSHAVGHFNGGAWSYDEWKQEFDSFSTLMANTKQNNPTVSIDEPTFLSSIHGFRAPQLGVDANLYKVLSDHHFTYDASGVAATDSWPSKDANGVWHISLGMIHLGTDPRPVISMDYNLWSRQSDTKELAVKGSELWNTYLNQVEAAYMEYFNTDYNGNRGPIVIADHFSKWNDGVYWEAMKSFARNVCSKPQVRCVTFGQLVDYLNSNGVPAVVK